MKNEILMHKGISLWLTRNTKLTNEQIADFCHMHEMEVSALRTGSTSIIECNPIDSFILSIDDIKACEENSAFSLKVLKLDFNQSKSRKSADFIRKTEVDCAILWILEKNKDVKNSEIVSLLPCTLNVVEKIRDKSYKYYEQLIPKHPVVLDLCSQSNLEKLIAKHS